MTTKAHAQYFCNTFFIVSLLLIHIRFHRVKEGIQIIDHSLFITCQDIVNRQGMEVCFTGPVLLQPHQVTIRKGIFGHPSKR